eukprot:1201750-Pleurochrysis_carterae.AAC.1
MHHYFCVNDERVSSRAADQAGPGTSLCALCAGVALCEDGTTESADGSSADGTVRTTVANNSSSGAGAAHEPKSNTVGVFTDNGKPMAAALRRNHLIMYTGSLSLELTGPV